MSKLRKRIESLSSSTTSLKAVELCKEALNKLSEYTTNFRLNPVMLENIEGTVGKVLIEGLELAADKDKTVNDFIVTEKRIVAINNLGVRDAITAAKSTDIYSHPTFRYVAESLARLEGLPEYLTAQTVVEKLAYFNFEPTIAQHVKTIQENMNTYAEDIRIYTAVNELNEKSSAFLYSSFEKQLETYLNHRTEVNRSRLLEALGKFQHDAFVRNLYNVISESTTNFTIKSTSDTCNTETVYSPVLVMSEGEMFNVNGKFFAKSGNEVTPLTESELTELSEDFIFVSNYINQSNVNVSENSVTIFNRDKKVIISESENGVTVSVNGKNVSREDFTKIYMNAGVFRRDEIAEMTNIQRVIENWDSIMELDFVKTLRSKLNPSQYVNVFSIDETIHINKVNPAMNENNFYPHVTATQSRNMVLEFMNYDLGVTFKRVLPKEEYAITTLTEKKKEYLTAINNLEEKRTMLVNHPDERVRASAEVKELIESIVDEINNLKDEYFTVQSQINKITNIEEGIGFAAGDEATVAKKKLG